METYCTTSRNSKYMPTLNSNNFYQASTYSRNFRQNEYCFTKSKRNSVILQHVMTHPEKKKSKRKFCSVALIVTAFIVLVAVLSIAGLALYMGALRTNINSLVTFSCSAKVSHGDRFISGLQEKARKYRLQLETLYQKSILGTSFVSCAIEKFGNDTLTMFFKIVLNPRKVPKQIDNLEKKLKDILLSDAVTRKPIFRNVRFDPKSISIKQILNSESYQRVITQPKNVPKSRLDVLMKAPAKTNLTLSTDLPIRKRPGEVMIGEVDIKEEDVPVTQGSFKITKTEADLTEKKTIPSEITQKSKYMNNTQTSKITPNIKEISILGALFKLTSSEQKSSTTIVTISESESTPTTTTTTITTLKPSVSEFKHLTTKSSINHFLNPPLFSVSPNLLNQEPWVPMYNTKPSTEVEGGSQLHYNNEPIYTSFTNADLSFDSLDTVKLGSTNLQGHPIPVNKIPIVTEYTSEDITKSPDTYFATEDSIVPLMENKQDKFDLYNLQSANVNADQGFVEVETWKYVPGSGSGVLNNSLVILNDTQILQDDYKLKQSTVLKNVSSIFHNYNTNEESTETITEYVKVGGNIVGQGQVEVVDADDILQTTKQSLVTLMPVKSNSGVGRPIRPRPKLKGNPALQNETDSVIENRSFPGNDTELKTNYYLETPTKYFETEVVNSVSSKLNKIKINKSQLTEFAVDTNLKFEFEAPVKNEIKDKASNEAPDHLSDENTQTIVTTETPTKQENYSEDEVAVLGTNLSIINQTNEGVQYLSLEKIKQLSEISKLSNNESIDDDGVISTKAVSSSYTINHAGIKIRTKTFNKTANSFKEEENKIAGDYNSFYLSISNKSECSKFTVKCGDGKCLPDSIRCNQLLDCNDGADEKNCNCADYLRSQFLLSKICDGIVDCWDFSDENQCDWCTPVQYVCGNSKVCINKTNICDGIRDCPHGDDERQCVTVASNVNAADEFPYYSEGYLMVRKHGQWAKLCVDNFKTVVSKSRTVWTVEDLGQAVCKAMTYKSLDQVKILRENKLKSIYRNSKYFELSYSFQNGTKSSLSFETTSCSAGEVVRIKCQSLECGTRPQATKQVARRSYRIVGGSNAGLGAWPWQAALYKEGEFQCGATLISDKWLLSAGHCFYHSLEDHWVARLGALRRGTALPSPYEQLRPIVEIILHPDYVDAGFINDISLLRMEVPVIYSDYVRPICLPPTGVALSDGRLCTVVGWGQLFEIGRIFPDTLQEVQVPVISTIECRKRTLFLPLYRVTDDMFCAGYDTGGRDACLGDSGGPLMCPEVDGRWVLHGITSNGYGCARAYRPGVYTNVANYIIWINSYTQREDNEKSVIKTSCLGHRCPLGECLPKTRLCNGFIECSDGSDEAGCLNH